MIVVHLGAHRTGTTSFQSTLQSNRKTLLASGIRYIGPDETRSGLFDHLMKRKPQLTRDETNAAKESADHLREFLDREERSSNRVVLSEENIIGSIRRNISTRSMYPEVHQSLAMLAPAFSRIDTFFITIRELEQWWNSCLSFAIGRFLEPPDEALLNQISEGSLGWRRLIETILELFPSANVKVLEFGQLSSSPKELLEAVCGWQNLPELECNMNLLNRSRTIEELTKLVMERGTRAQHVKLAGKGRMLNLFSEHASAKLRQTYCDDLAWLQSNTETRLQFIGTARPF